MTTAFSLSNLRLTGYLLEENNHLREKKIHDIILPF